MNISEIKKIKSLEDILLRVLLWGESGTGKTRSAATFPDPYFFDFDGGMLSVRKELKEGKIDGKSYGLHDWEMFRRDWDKIKKAPTHKTYVFDSLTTLCDAMEWYMLKTANKAIQEGLTLPMYKLAYGKLAQLAQEMMELSAHTVLIAHVEILIDEKTKEIKEVPLASGRKFPNRVEIWFDEVFKQEIVRKGTEQVPSWRVKHSKRVKAKSRLGIKLASIEPPTYQEYLKQLASAMLKLEVGR